MSSVTYKSLRAGAEKGTSDTRTMIPAPADIANIEFGSSVGKFTRDVRRSVNRFNKDLSGRVFGPGKSNASELLALFLAGLSIPLSILQLAG